MGGECQFGRSRASSAIDLIVVQRYSEADLVRPQLTCVPNHCVERIRELEDLFHRSRAACATLLACLGVRPARNAFSPSFHFSRSCDKTVQRLHGDSLTQALGELSLCCNHCAWLAVCAQKKVKLVQPFISFWAQLKDSAKPCSD